MLFSRVQEPSVLLVSKRWVKRHYQVDQHQQVVDHPRVVVQNCPRVHSVVSLVHQHHHLVVDCH